MQKTKEPAQKIISQAYKDIKAIHKLQEKKRVQFDKEWNKWGVKQSKE